MSSDSESSEEPHSKQVPLNQEVVFSCPEATDGYSVHQLISACPPLDTNSIYCNLLQCHHFADTSVKVEKQGELVGFISGYLIPGRENVLFVWQVAVSPLARGMNLGVRMIENILSRENCSGVDFVETTITPDNDASWGLFKKLARTLDCSYQSTPLFEQQKHFGGEAHNDEVLVRIGPFANPGSKT